MPNNTYFNTLFLCVWLQVIKKVKFIHQGEGHIKFKVKYLHPFRFYVAHTFCKWVVCIRLNAFLLRLKLIMHPYSLMAHSHCTGLGTGTGQGMGQGMGCSVHIAPRPGVGNIMRACLHVLERTLFQPRAFVFVVLRN